MEMPKEYRCVNVFCTESNIAEECNKMLNEGFVFVQAISEVKQNYYAYLLFAKY